MCNCCTLSLTAHSSGRCCIPTENHSIAGISRENHGIAGIPRENHGIAGIPRENHSIAGIPRENHSIAGSFAAQEGQIGWLQKELKQRTKESSWESHLSLGHLHIEHAYVLSVVKAPQLWTEEEPWLLVISAGPASFSAQEKISGGFWRPLLLWRNLFWLLISGTQVLNCVS